MAEQTIPKQLATPSVNSSTILAGSTIFCYAAGLVLGFVLMEVPCYADWCLEHQQPFAKANSQIALGVFYVWTAIAFAFLILTNRNKKLQRKLRNPFVVPFVKPLSYSLGELLFIIWVAALLAFNLGFFTVQVEALLSSEPYARRKLNPFRRQAFYWTMMTGKLTDVAMGLSMLLTAKNSGYASLFGVSVDRYVRVHRGVGYFLWVAIALHTILYLVFTAQYRTLPDLISVLFYGSQKSATHDHPLGWGEGNWMVTMGTYSTIVFIFVAIFSLPIVRRRAFRLFYYSHFLVFPAMIFAYLHAASDFYYCIPGLGLYAIDLLFRTRASVTLVKVEKVVEEPTGHVRVDFTWPAGLERTTAGSQWGLFNFPTVSRLDWHPYSFANAPGSSAGTILFKPNRTLKPSTNFENSLARALLANPDQEAQSTALTLRLDGPFGSINFAPAEQDCVVCIVAGTGVSPAFGVIRQTLAESTKCRVVLLWSLKESRGELVSLVQEVIQEGGDRLECKIFCTETDADSSSSNEEEPSLLKKDLKVSSETFTSSSNSIRLSNKRLLASDEFSLCVPKDIRSLGIFICGPPAFTEDMRVASCKFAEAHKSMEVSIQEDGFEF